VAQVEWKTEWKDVTAAAAEAGKPIFWVNLVGDLDGAT
jgi:hypothetical protein